MTYLALAPYRGVSPANGDTVISPSTVLSVGVSALGSLAASPFPSDYPLNQRTFFSPVDDVHGVLLACLGAAQSSLVLTMYGFDDDPIANLIKAKCEDPNIVVQLTLDASQATGAHEKGLLTQEQYPSTVIAIGNSEKGAIMHQKIAVIDGILCITGSTNFSGSGESDQDNQLTVTMDRALAAQCRARADAIHSHILIGGK